MMKNYIKLLIALLGLVIFKPELEVFTQENDIRFKHLSVEDGLSNAIVKCIFKDSKGFFWFGTYEGLNRFDGYEFVVYRNIRNNPNSLTNNQVEDIVEDDEGNLWIATLQGINKYVREKDHFERFEASNVDENGLKNDQSTSLLKDSDGIIWVATAGGLAWYHKIKKKFFFFEHDENNQNSIASNGVLKVYEDKNKNIWIGTAGAGVDVYHKKKKTFTHYSEGDYFKDYINYIKEDSKGQIWLGTDAGLKLFTPNGPDFFKHYKHNPEDPSSITNGSVRAILEDTKQNIWVGSQNGLNRFNHLTETFVRYQKDEHDRYSITTNEVWSIFEEDNGVIWVGNYMGGLQIYNPAHRFFEHWKHSPGDEKSLANNSVYAFIDNNDGTYWIGVDHGGLMLFDLKDGIIEHYVNQPEDESSIGSNSILSLLKDSKGNLWAGTWAGGLNKYDESTKSFVRFMPDENDENSLSNPHVWDVFEDSNGQYWIGTMSGGVCLYNSEANNFKRFLHNEDDKTSLPSNTVWSIYEDKEKNIWVCTTGGLALFNKKSRGFKAYKNDVDDIKSISHNNVFSVYEDSEGRFWACTDGGLNLYDRKTREFKAYFIENGLPNNIIRGMVEDKKGNLWISTNRGLSKMIIKDGESVFYNFDKSNGLVGDEFNRGALMKSENGRLFFGSSKGFTAFNPSKVKFNDKKPPVVITDFKIFNKPVVIDKEGNTPLKKHISLTREITLTHKEAVFSFEFSALNYISPEKNRYEYMLENFDQTWNKISSKRRFATYTNIPPGDYVFKVRASNNDGVWNKKGRSIKISILPPWWKTWWFRLLIFIIVVSMLTILYKLRVKQHKRRREELEIAFHERTADLKKMIKLIRANSEKLTHTGSNLKSKSLVLTEGTENQKESAGKISNEVEFVTNKIRNSTENASKANQIASNIINDIEKIHLAAKQNMGEINNISDKIEIINKISEKTDVLAINASIEAARAGAAGEGFSVVATEIRKLAEISAQASEEIIESTKRGVDSTKIVGVLLNDFVKVIEDIAKIIHQISEDGDSQRYAIENIDDSLKSFYKTTTENSLTSKEISEISSTLDELSTYLMQQISKLKIK